MNEITPITKDYYRKRLKAFLTERHPRLCGNQNFIRSRSEAAFQIYRQSIEAGLTNLTATTRADAVLYDGLIFSRYDTLRCILATEYPKMPEPQQRTLALYFEGHFEEIFAKYNLDDGLVGRSEYNHLIVELIQAIEDYFSRHELYVRFKGRPKKEK